MIPYGFALCYRIERKNGLPAISRRPCWRKWRKWQVKRTAARQIDTAEAGSYSAAANLILRVKPTGSRSWVFRYTSNGKAVEIGLGKAGTKERGLAEARELAERMQAALRNGVDPKTILKPKHDASALTFRHYANSYIKQLRATPRHGKPRNVKAVDQWAATLTKWAFDYKAVGASAGFGDKRPVEITYGDVKALLTQRSLAALAETQKRMKQRIGVILAEAAKEEGEPHRYNPATAFKLETRKPDSIRRHAAARVCRATALPERTMRSVGQRAPRLRAADAADRPQVLDRRFPRARHQAFGHAGERGRARRKEGTERGA